MNNLIQDDADHIWHPYTPLIVKKKYPEVVAAKGMYLHLADGRSLLDGISSWWVNIHGHGNESLANAVRDQMLQLDHTLFAGFTHKPAVQFATRFLKVLQCKQQRVFYSENGSTAVEVALKLSVQYWRNKGQQKSVFIAIEGAFHGDTFGAMSVSARGLFTAAFEPVLSEVLFLPFPDGSNDELVIEQLRTYLKQTNVAAFIYEPLVQGSGGMRMYEPVLLNQLMALCKAHQVLCIADEVMTGFGRTGKAFASQYCEETPDMMCFSKAITGGLLPLGVTTCTAEVNEPFMSSDIYQAFYHGHSYMANATICQLALTSLSLFESDECQTNIQRIAVAHEVFASKNKKHLSIKRIQTLGTILVIEFHTKDGISSYEHEIRHYLYDYFINHGILLRPLGNVIYVMPPYIIDSQQLEYIYSCIENMLESLQ